MASARRATAPAATRSAAGALLFAAAIAAQAGSAPLGVYLWRDAPQDEAILAGMRAGLTAAGCTAELVARRGDADPRRAAQLLGELRSAGCALVFAIGTPAALQAAQAIVDVPVVFAGVTDPVTAGLVPDWQGSGRNVCGASAWIDPENALEVFRLAVPGLRRLGMLRCRRSGSVAAAEFAAMRLHLQRLPEQRRLELVEAVAGDDGDLEQAVRELLARGVDAIWLPADVVVLQHLPAIERYLGGARVPLVSTTASAVRSGALVGTGIDHQLHGRRAAALALEVLLRGRDPAVLPVDRLQSTMVVVNLAAAHRNGIELPLSLLALADELIAPELPHGDRR